MYSFETDAGDIKVKTMGERDVRTPSLDDEQLLLQNREKHRKELQQLFEKMSKGGGSQAVLAPSAAWSPFSLMRRLFRRGKSDDQMAHSVADSRGVHRFISLVNEHVETITAQGFFESE